MARPTASVTAPVLGVPAQLKVKVTGRPASCRVPFLGSVRVAVVLKTSRAAAETGFRAMAVGRCCTVTVMVLALVPYSGSPSK